MTASAMPADHKSVPVWNAENWHYEDFEMGHRIRSVRRTISEGESMQFNALVLDMHPYVADELFATTEGQFGRRLVAGAFVFSAGLGLVATNNVNAFSYGYDRLRFIKPVFIGDTIYTIRTNLAKEPKYEKLGLIRASYEVFKGSGELVLYCEHLQTVLYRDGVPPSVTRSVADPGLAVGGGARVGSALPPVMGEDPPTLIPEVGAT